MSTSATPVTSATPYKVISTKNPDICYSDRFSYRIILFDASGRVAILQLRLHFRYRLLGGFKETGLDHKEATVHERISHTDGRVKLRDGLSIASTEEWRDDIHARQESYCYLGDLVQTVQEGGMTVRC